jgi:hypothetical protein
LLPDMKPCHLDARDSASFPGFNPDQPGYLEMIGMAMAWDYRIRHNAGLGRSILRNVKKTDWYIISFAL